MSPLTRIEIEIAGKIFKVFHNHHVPSIGDTIYISYELTVEVIKRRWVFDGNKLDCVLVVNKIE